MNRQGGTADEAFDLLRRTSQDLNVKLVDLARTLTGRHAELDRNWVRAPGRVWWIIVRALRAQAAP